MNELQKAKYFIEKLIKKGYCADSYTDWILRGLELSSLGEDARELFHKLSQTSNKYDCSECDAKYDGFLKDRSGARDIASFFRIAIHDFGIPSPKLNGQDNQKRSNQKKKQEKADSNTQEKKPSGKPIKLESYADVLADSFNVKRNLMTGQLEVDGVKLSDDSINKVRLKLNDDHGIFLSRDKMNMVLSSDRYPNYHPIQDIISKYHGMNCSGYIDAFCKQVKAKQGAEYFKFFFTKWYVGMVVNSHEEDCSPNDLMFCLLGEKQGVGKTLLLEKFLLPKSLQQYISKDFSRGFSSIEMKMAMATKILLFDDELDGITKAEITHLKSALSLQYIDVTEKFKNLPSRHKRRASFCGSGNNLQILKERENRRLIPVQVVSIDIEGLKKIDTEKMLVEAWRLYKAEGFRYWINEKEIKILNDNSGEFEIPDSEHELVTTAFEAGMEGSGEWLPMAVIQSKIKRKFNLNYLPSAEKMGKALSKAGIQMERKRHRGQMTRLYFVKSLNFTNYDV